MKRTDSRVRPAGIPDQRGCPGEAATSLDCGCEKWRKLDRSHGDGGGSQEKSERSDTSQPVNAHKQSDIPSPSGRLTANIRRYDVFMTASKEKTHWLGAVMRGFASTVQTEINTDNSVNK